MRPLLSFVVAIAPTLAWAGPPTIDLDISGSCPGLVALDIEGLTPSGPVAILKGTGVAARTIPAGPCSGTAFGLSGGRLFRQLTADASGRASMQGTAPAGVCGTHFQVLDVSTCTVSDIEVLGGLGTCTEDMEPGNCPTAGNQVCGATFSGAAGCVIDGIGSCYSSGGFSYAVDGPGPAGMIAFDEPVNRAELFLSGVDGSTAVVNWLDAAGRIVSTSTNGDDCRPAMPAMTVVDFSRPVSSAVITAIGGRIYVDDFTVNP